MKSLQTLLGHVYLPLTAILTCSFAFHSLPVSAIDILNSASAAGDNLPPEGVKSNETSVTAGQATLELIKTGDRAAAEPGDTVVYRLALKNTGTAAASNIVITDTLPVGLRYEPKSLQASLTTGTSTARTTIQPASTSNRTVTFRFPRLAPNETLNIVYAAVVTPDAIRGNGRNQAQETRSNIASHQLRIRPGILSDCGTLIGRVFVDKNFDGEQQPGEPGVPNAVIFMDDGNRITTDANGLFSLANVISGYRTGTLDLTSLPGYTLAPNQKFIERNSQSRLVQLEPGGLVRMNFGVTPAYREGQQ
ncbi:MAG: isopeptide-forming domain-containing fimbrial protein [Cyanobacteriota bacterium]